MSLQDVPVAEKLPAWHQRQRAGETRIGEMGDMPVVGALPALLRQVRPGALRAQQRRASAHVIARLGDAIGAVTPVQDTNVLRVAIAASIPHVQAMALFFLVRQQSPNVGWRRIERGGRDDHHDGDRRPEHHQSTHKQQSGGHLHANTSSSSAGSNRGPRYRVIRTLYRPITAPLKIANPNTVRMTKYG